MSVEVPQEYRRAACPLCGGRLFVWEFWPDYSTPQGLAPNEGPTDDPAYAGCYWWRKPVYWYEDRASVEFVKYVHGWPGEWLPLSPIDAVRCTGCRPVRGDATAHYKAAIEEAIHERYRAELVEHFRCDRCLTSGGDANDFTELVADDESFTLCVACYLTAKHDLGFTDADSEEIQRRRP